MNIPLIKKDLALGKWLFRSGYCLLISMNLCQTAAALVYTASNEAEGNRVIAFDVLEDSGKLSEVGSFPTGGTGTRETDPETRC